MLKKILTILFLTYSFILTAQKSVEYKGEIINALDENGKKTGLWKLYDDKNGLLITCEFKNGEYVSETKYYKNSNLIASLNNDKNQLKIYKDSKIINASFFRKPNNGQTLISENGEELDTETLRYFYFSAEILPFFYGGIQELYSFIGDNFDRKGNKGKVKIQFNIDSKGYTSDIKIIESSNPKLDEEAIRVISILPRWQPGHQGGDFVKCPYVIPITIN